jgi:hypothetical protein
VFDRGVDAFMPRGGLQQGGHDPGDLPLAEGSAQVMGRSVLHHFHPPAGLSV